MSNQVYKNKEEVYQVVNSTQHNFFGESLSIPIPNTGIEQDILTISPLLEQGRYFIYASTQIEALAGSASYQVRFLVDAVQQKLEDFEIPNALQRNSVPYSVINNFTSGVHTFQINARALTPTDGTAIQSYISLIKLA